MFVLIPPSEGKATDTLSPSKVKVATALLKDTKGVQTHLKHLSPTELQKFYSAKTPEKTAVVHALNLGVTKAPAIPAIERYTGVVYQHLDYTTLKHKAYARKHLLFISGLWGLIPAGEVIPDYKLPINTWLAKYWREINGQRLQDLAKGKLVLNLLPHAYAKAIHYDNLITVNFKVQDGKKSAGHFAKAIKGKFLRFLMENKIKSTNEFNKFTEDGYRWDGTDFIQH